MSDEGGTPGGARPRELGVVASEFGTVSVSVDAEGNSTRLRLEDLRTGAVRYLDALELESIVWAPEHWMRALLDPSQHRWRDADPGPSQESLRGGGSAPAAP